MAFHLLLVFTAVLSMLPMVVSGSGGTGPGVSPVVARYDWIGNTPLSIGAHGGVLAGFAAGAAVADPGTRTSRQGGSVTLNADGSFTYMSSMHIGHGHAEGDDSFTFTVWDGIATLSASAIVHIDGAAWYVDNRVMPGGHGTHGEHAGKGTLDMPFKTLAETVAPSWAGDIIFVFSGDGTSTGLDRGIVLENGQKLIGQGVGFTYNGVTIVPPGTAPKITNTREMAGAAPVIRLSHNTEVAGFQIQGTPGVANAGVVGNGIIKFDIHDNTFTGLAREAVHITGASVDGRITGNTFWALTGSGRAVDIVADAPGGFDLTVSGNTLYNPTGGGIRVRYTGNSPGGTANISRNRILAIAGDGIGLDVSGTGGVSAAMDGNTIGEGPNGPTGNGIRIWATDSSATRANLSGNTVSGAGQNGIRAESHLAATLMISMTANTVSGSAQEGIVLQSHEASVFQAGIDGNTLTGNRGSRAGFHGESRGSSQFCLELTGNTGSDGFFVPGAGTRDLGIHHAGNSIMPELSGRTRIALPGECL